MRRQDCIALGFMTFALFLGAGNVIYPPMLGQQAGHELIFAAVGFLLTAVGLPLITLVSMAFVGGPRQMTELLPKRWGILFWSALFIVIGPAFAIPRTAVVAYELGAVSFLTDPQSWHLALYTVAFFGISLALALNPGSMVHTIGRFMTPALLILLAIIGAGVLLNPQGGIQAPIGDYVSTPFSEGLIQGYMTMDCLGALGFGAVIGHAIRQLGITDPKAIAKCTIQAGLIAAAGLGLVYILLMYLGATSSTVAVGADNGGKILALYVSALFGLPGKIALTGIITLACLTTAVGVSSACADYFSELSGKRISYRKTLVVIMALSALVANVGLTQLISFSVPVIIAIYPIAIALVVMGLLRSKMPAATRIYTLTIPVVALFALADGLNAANLLPEALKLQMTQWLPLFDQGLGWIAPFILILLFSWLTSTREQTVLAKTA